LSWWARVDADVKRDLTLGERRLMHAAMLGGRCPAVPPRLSGNCLYPGRATSWRGDARIACNSPINSLIRRFAMVSGARRRTGRALPELLDVSGTNTPGEGCGRTTLQRVQRG